MKCDTEPSRLASCLLTVLFVSNDYHSKLCVELYNLVSCSEIASHISSVTSFSIFYVYEQHSKILKFFFFYNFNVYAFMSMCAVRLNCGETVVYIVFF